jgi:hypothetical protein
MKVWEIGKERERDMKAEKRECERKERRGKAEKRESVRGDEGESEEEKMGKPWGKGGRKGIIDITFAGLGKEHSIGEIAKILSEELGKNIKTESYSKEELLARGYHPVFLFFFLLFFFFSLLCFFFSYIVYLAISQCWWVQVNW